jgi:microcystin-dependent protein
MAVGCLCLYSIHHQDGLGSRAAVLSHISFNFLILRAGNHGPLADSLSMKRTLAFIITCCPMLTMAQNVGIDVPAPAQKLDVAGGIRIADAPQALEGSVRYANGQFEVCTTDGSWTPLGAATPAGGIIAFGGSAAPSGWLLCDGASYPASGAYAQLYAAIGCAFGCSGGNFNVPDLRGRFLRGVDGTANRDPDKAARTAMTTGGNAGNTVGSVQGHAFQSHNHPPICGGTFLHDWNSCGGGAIAANGSQIGIKVQSTTGNRGDSSETRPINASVNYIIKL